jgi:magnesium transporter
MAIINPISLLKRSLFAKKVGSSPGEYIYVGEMLKDVNISLIKYDTDSQESIDIENLEHLKKSFDHRKINWVNFDGVGNVDLIKSISEHFNFNSLMAEDILNTEHLPKSEEFKEHLFVVLKMIWLENRTEQVEIIKEHISIVLGDNYVISFQDSVEGDVFNSIRQRIMTGKGQIRRKGPDYLFYTLIDSIVDNYLLVMEYIREEVEDLEDFMLSNPSENMNEKIILLRRKISELRRMIYMIHEAVRHIISSESDFIDIDTNPYLKDVLDHTRHLDSSFDTFRDYVSNIMDMYMSNMSNNLNIIMKTLTIFSLFFVPLTFLAGIYGMNFQYMPELGIKWGYPVILGIMILISILMYFYMKRKKWL